jgi:hypothetical protein
MIEYALLVMLGFCMAGLLALLIAPTVWNRAVRLTTKRLDATLPMSLSDIEADKDLLRASYAIQIRRLEAGLTKARDKSASQLVEISKLQMVIGEMRDRAATLEKQLEERRNAANVFERTITKRFPEMEAALSTAKAALDERAYEIADLNNKLNRKEEALTLLQRSSALQQAEIRKLRETLEGGAADRTGRFKKRPAQWSLEEFRSEYDRLNLELSKMREMLALAHERESGQVAVLRGELQNLAQQIMTSVAAKETAATQQRQSEAIPPAPPRRDPGPQRRGPSERHSAPQPWPGGVERPGEPPRAPSTAARTSAPPIPPAPAPRSEAPVRRESESAPPRSGEGRRPSIAEEAATGGGAKSETSALQSLLDRAAAVMQRDDKVEATGAGTAVLPPAREQAAPASQVDTLENRPAAARSDPAPTERPTPASPGATEPNIDRMLREIFEGRGGPAPSAPPQGATPAAGSPDAKAGHDGPSAPALHGESKPAGEKEGEANAEQKRSLAERLRVV